MVYLGTTAAATLVNLIFPFFTYVPSSGWLGDNLPQVRCIRKIDTHLERRIRIQKDRYTFVCTTGSPIDCIAGMGVAFGGGGMGGGRWLRDAYLRHHLLAPQ